MNIKQGHERTESNRSESLHFVRASFVLYRVHDTRYILKIISSPNTNACPNTRKPQPRDTDGPPPYAYLRYRMKVGSIEQWGCPSTVFLRCQSFHHCNSNTSHFSRDLCIHYKVSRETRILPHAVRKYQRIHTIA